MSEYLLQEEGFDKDGENSEDVHDVQERHGDDHSRHEGLEIMSFSETKINSNASIKSYVYSEKDPSLSY